MKKMLIILVLLLVVAPKTYSSEDTFQLRPAYLPNKIYHIKSKMESTTISDLQADEKTRKKFTPPGVKFPMKTKDNREFLWIIETGEKQDDGSFMLTAKLEQTKATREIDNNVINLPDPMAKGSGMEIRGKMLADGNIVMQEFKVEEMDEAMKKTMARLILDLMKGIQPEEKPLKVGDEFTRQTFQKLPTGGGPPLDLELTTRHKLTSIKNGKAYFNINQNASLTSPPAGFRGKLDGHGSGTMTYDIGLSFVTYRCVDMKMNMLVETPAFCLKNDMTSKEEIRIEIRNKR